MDLLKYEKEYSIHVYETGPDGRLTLFSLFDYLQDIASDHAVKLGYGRDELLKQNNFWVLSRIYAEISSIPEWNRTITIRTWPRGTDKLFALRDYEVRYSDGRQIARATSSWLIVDRFSKRIQRPDNTLSMYYSDLPREKALIRNAAKIEPAPPDRRNTPVSIVRISDLDINLHTNNVRYVKWIYDSYTLDFIMNHTPLSVEINYLAESHYNDIISILIAEENNTEKIFNHSIVRTTDNTELCRLKIKWKNNHI
jgi:medium-chain acyl-[acyl-carrier-protein] hydrolase